MKKRVLELPLVEIADEVCAVYIHHRELLSNIARILAKLSLHQAASLRCAVGRDR